MANFASKNFAFELYASIRPSYPPELYNRVFSYHKGRHNLALDLGTGHGIVARHISDSFEQVYASDVSSGMIEQARKLSSSHSNITYHKSPAEGSGFLEDGEVDLVTAAECAHWFDYDKFWPEMARILKPDGTLAIWGYGSFELVDYPRASKVMEFYTNGMDERLLGSYWPEPGHRILIENLKAVIPPAREWSDIQRLEYVPGTEGPHSGHGTVLIEKRITLGTLMQLVRTWSAYHGWQEQWPNRKPRGLDDNTNGPGDVVDEMFDAMRDADPSLRVYTDANGIYASEVRLESRSALILARRAS